MSQAYHGVTAGQHQANFNSLSAQGYRMISLSVYGNVRAGSRHISISEQNGRDGKMILRSMAIYGSPIDRLFIGVRHPNPGYTKWRVHYAEAGAKYQAMFNPETSNPFYRPTELAVSSDHLYCSLFKDDMVGPWVARHGMTSAQYQSEFDVQNARGFYPISVQGGGSGGDTRYAAILTQRDLPLPRHWHVPGTEVPSLAGFDHAMKTFMQADRRESAAIDRGDDRG